MVLSEDYFYICSNISKQRELTEEEEWDQLNERLRVREQERLERERKQAEDDARRLEELSNVSPTCFK